MKRLLTDVLKSQVASRPRHTAICWKDERISYGELDRLTNQLAHTLRIHGCRHGDRIPVLIPNSANAIFAALGILKAACVAVPIDMKSSSDALAEVVRECRPPVILAARAARPILDELLANHFLADHSFASISIGTVEVLPIEGEHFATDFSGLDVLRELPGPLACGAARRAPAFLLNNVDLLNDIEKTRRHEDACVKPWRPTAISHAEILTALSTFCGGSGLNEFDRVAASSLHCPSGIIEAFAGLAAGAELHVVPEDVVDRARELANFARHHQLTRWLTNQALLEELVRDELILDGDLPSLKQLSWVGAPLPASSLRDLMQRLPLTEFTRVAKDADAKMSELRRVVQHVHEEETIFAVAPHPDVVAVR